MELRAYQAYRNPEMRISYWRTSSGQEVDFVLGDCEVAIEIKAGKVHEGDLRGLGVLIEETSVKKAIVVSFEKEPRRIKNHIDILPWQSFLRLLWDGQLI
jgi:predicted AAA+ superfamily ATPase